MSHTIGFKVKVIHRDNSEVEDDDDIQPSFHYVEVNPGVASPSYIFESRIEAYRAKERVLSMIATGSRVRIVRLVTP